MPPATRLLTGLLVAFSLIGFLVRCVFTSSLPSSPSSFPSGLDSPVGQYGIFSPAPRQDFPWLFLVPGKVIYNPWTLITAGFAEGNLFEVRPVQLRAPEAYQYELVDATARADASPPPHPHPRSQFIVSLLSIPLCARYLERVWSYTELLKFALVTVLASNIISVGFSWIVYFVLNDVKSMCVALLALAPALFRRAAN